MDGRGAAAVWPRRASHDGGGEVEGVGSPVHFSESRFLQRLLCQARQGSGLGDPAGGECHDRALASLEAMGFDREVAQVALHVSRGREDQALQLCMAGLSFVGASGEGALCDRAPPAPLRCYVCGLGHLSRCSLDCHLRSCRRRFEQREARRPAGERRALLGEEELAPGAQTIEEHYLRLAWPEPAGSGGGARPSGSAGGAGRAASAGAAAGPQRAPVQLLPCEFCARTFLPGRLEAHQKACVQRPRHVAPAPSPAARSPAPASPAAVRAFRSFCEQLERCPGCQRQFRPEVLRSHRERCPPCQRPPGARPSQLVRSTGRRHSQPVPAAAPRASFAPPARGAPAPKASTPDAEVCTSEALLAKGLLLAAGEEDAAALRAELELSLPGAEFVSAFQVAGPAVSSGVYEALRASMQDCGGGGPPAERELWHGTAWAAVSCAGATTAASRGATAPCWGWPPTFPPTWRTPSASATAQAARTARRPPSCRECWSEG
ncbi:unnamed protein product, partial [Prorocentrum cordatum]